MTTERKDIGNLIIARKAGERVFIGEDITISVLAVLEGSVRFKISAPKSIRIDREECKLPT